MVIKLTTALLKVYFLVMTSKRCYVVQKGAIIQGRRLFEKKNDNVTKFQNQQA